MYYVRSHVTKYFHIFFPDISYFYQAVRERYERGEGGREGERERELVGGVLGNIHAESKLGNGSPKYSKRCQAHGRRHVLVNKVKIMDNNKVVDIN